MARTGSRLECDGDDIAVEVDFDEIVALFGKAWANSRGPGMRGSDPCRLGLGRSVIANPAFRGVAR